MRHYGAVWQLYTFIAGAKTKNMKKLGKNGPLGIIT